MADIIAFIVLQFLIYLTATIDFRAVQTNRYMWVVVTNASLPMLGYAMTNLVIEAHQGFLGAIAVAVGGVGASLFGMWLTRHWRDDGRS